jgi:hypothetical protein
MSTNAVPSFRAHVTKKDKTVIEVKDSVLKQSRAMALRRPLRLRSILGAAVEAEVDSELRPL